MPSDVLPSPNIWATWSSQSIGSGVAFQQMVNYVDRGIVSAYGIPRGLSDNASPGNQPFGAVPTRTHWRAHPVPFSSNRPAGAFESLAL